MTPPDSGAELVSAWGGLVTIYLLAIGLPAGLSLVSWWLTSQHPQHGGWLERPANLVSLVAMVAISGLLVVDLGRPGGFFLMLTRFDNLGSPIAVGAKLVAAKTALLALAVYATERQRWPTVAPVTAGGSGSGGTGTTRAGAALRPATRILLAATSLGLAIYPAALLSRTWSSPLAGTSGAALLFLTSSLLFGAAAATAIALATAAPLAAMRRLLAVLLAGHAIALLFQILAVGGDPRVAGAVAAVATGEYAGLWWVGGVVAGVVAPAAVLALLPRRRLALGLAAAGAAVGAGTVRYLLFAAGG